MSVLPKCSRTGRRVAYLAVATALLGLPTLAVAGGDEVFSLTQTVSVPGLASFDISYIDPSLHAYFLADRSNKTVDVIDTATKAHTTLGTGFTGVVSPCAFPNACNGPDGVFTVHQGDSDHDWDWGNHKGRTEVWAGDGNSTVKVLDYPSGTLLKTISTGGSFRADEGCWDADDHLVLIANDSEVSTSGAPAPFISFISTDTYKIVKRVTFDGTSAPKATNGIEQCNWNEREHAFYLNLPEVNGPGDDTADGATVVINPHSFKIERIFDIPVADCAGPQGMATGPAPQIALGCNAKTVPGGVRNSVVINEENGSVIAVLANEGGTDEAWFNPGDGHYFFANSTPGSTAPLTPQYLGIVDSRNDQPDQTIVTQASSAVGAHSVAADPVQNQAYVPVAGGVNIYSPQGHDDRQVYVYRGQ